MIVKANSSLNNKTGSWRSYRPEIDVNKCIACGLCEKICPDGAVFLSKNTKSCVLSENTKSCVPIVNYDYCKGCGLCAKECPVKAIKMLEE